MAMDFFEHQDAARRRTARLVVLFVLAVACIVAVVYLAAAYLLMNLHHDKSQPLGYGEWNGGELWNGQLFLIVSGATLAVIALGSLFKTLELWRGGETVALLFGGRLVTADTDDLAERRLLNVVEEMALASGVPVPPVYVLDHEGAINAFAAGYTPSDAVVSVTRGTLEFLDRDELQGVVAHEFSHILNGDMRLNVRLIGLLHGILLVSLLGYFLMRHAFLTGAARKKGGGGAAVLVFGLTLYLVGYIGVFFGRLIKSGVSRQREFLADASAVQFTRNPQGIVGALTKIGGFLDESRIRDPHAEEASHLFFSDAFGDWPLNLLATHPPLAARIRRIDPSFDGKFPRIRHGLPAQAASAARDAPPAFSEAAVRSQAEIRLLRARAQRRQLTSEETVARVGVPDVQGLHYAQEMLAALPGELTRAAHEPYGARAVVYALLLDADARVRRAQLARLETQAEEQSYRETLGLAELIDELGDAYRLPLLDISLSVLKSLSPRQYSRFRGAVESLVNADQAVALWEYVLWIVVVRHLDAHFANRKPARVRYRTMSAVADSAVLVVAMLAHSGHAEMAGVGQAYLLGRQKLGRDEPLPAREACTLGALDVALAKLALASPQVKRRVVDACTTCVLADGEATVREGELLRAVSEMLGCPMPPIPPAAIEE